MKIVKAESILVSVPFEATGIPPWSFGGNPRCAFDTLFVRLETDSGIVGWGEAFSRNEDRSLKMTLDTRVLPLVLGRNANEIGRIKQELEFRLHNFGRVGPIVYAISAVDIALWDIAGKAARMPLVDLLGGPFAQTIDVYASLLRFANVKELVRIVRQAIDRGYRYIKLHEITVPEIRAAVEAAGEDAKVMLDTNCPWTVAEALRYDRELAPLDLMWLEEPVWPPENYRGLAQVRATGRHRIAAGENAGSLMDFMHGCGQPDAVLFTDFRFSVVGKNSPALDNSSRTVHHRSRSRHKSRRSWDACILGVTSVAREAVPLEMPS